MIANNTKCEVKKVPAPIYAHLLGREVIAEEKHRASGASQAFRFEGGMIFAGGDTGFLVEEK